MLNLPSRPKCCQFSDLVSHSLVITVVVLSKITNNNDELSRCFCIVTTVLMLRKTPTFFHFQIMAITDDPVAKKRMNFQICRILSFFPVAKVTKNGDFLHLSHFGYGPVVENRKCYEFSKFCRILSKPKSSKILSHFGH